MTDNNLIISSHHTSSIIPEDNNSNLQLLDIIINSIGAPRSVVPNNYEISYALKELPRELNRIPSDLRDKFIARACIASAVGLFDGAIIYIYGTALLKSCVEK